MAWDYHLSVKKRHKFNLEKNIYFFSKSFPSLNNITSKLWNRLTWGHFQAQGQLYYWSKTLEKSSKEKSRRDSRSCPRESRNLFLLWLERTFRKERENHFLQVHGRSGEIQPADFLEFMQSQAALQKETHF